MTSAFYSGKIVVSLYCFVPVARDEINDFDNIGPRYRHGAPQRVVATCRCVGDALVEFKIEAANVAGVGGVLLRRW